MQIVINIDDNLYTRLFDNGVDNYDDAVDLAKAIRKGILLPKNATNGDVIKVLFPKVPIKIFKSMNTVTFGSTQFDLDWWNKPYKAGDTDGK